MYYNIVKRILCMSIKFCIVMYKNYGPVAFNCKIKYLYCIVLYCGHLLGKVWPLGSLVCYVLWRFCHFPMWCLASGVVLDCIDS